MNDYFNGTGTIGFTCDNCGREVQGCTWVNGMKFCAKCYQETFGNNTSQYVDMLHKEMYELKIATLEAKLAEKDRQIEQLKKFDNLNKTFFDLFRTAFKEPNKVDDLFNTLKTMQEKQDQDKISFCIEQLEKVKEFCEDYIEFKNEHQENWLYEYIDQQIKELKGK